MTAEITDINIKEKSTYTQMSMLHNQKATLLPAASAEKGKRENNTELMQIHVHLSAE